MEKTNIEDVTQKLNNLTIDKPYSRQKLIPIKDEKGKCSNVNEILSKLYNIDTISKVKKFDFYHYNCESVEDLGWGCAWRCIQSFISCFDDNLIKDIDYTFMSLFTNYGNKERLNALYVKSKGFDETPSYLKERNFAPHETQYGWAEPFIAYLIMADLGFIGNMLLLNSYPESAYAPQQVFDKTINYNEFKQLLLDNFAKYNPYPIMIDDSIITMLIIGIIKHNDNKLTLVIADPHVTNPEEGIYTVTLDETGNYSYELNTNKTKNGKKFLMSTKPWMIYYI